MLSADATADLSKVERVRHRSSIGMGMACGQLISASDRYRHFLKRFVKFLRQYYLRGRHKKPFIMLIFKDWMIKNFFFFHFCRKLIILVKLLVGTHKEQNYIKLQLFLNFKQYLLAKTLSYLENYQSQKDACPPKMIYDAMPRSYGNRTNRIA